MVNKALHIVVFVYIDAKYSKFVDEVQAKNLSGYAQVFWVRFVDEGA
ncbi:hypothetical protein THIAE_02890 [Thiomicrospira aerophila AL3]|uniref:Uncharacterized protein n=1 Tax=Thiomicrospira aerophila AL3 TaxID=717772 RepID=W0DUV6_9GAMM|nr:hypothetical protein THIAE_02890 [Thiomicrospira aerophila AL3]